MWIKVQTPRWLSAESRRLDSGGVGHITCVVTGRMASGKDYVANRLGCVVYNFSTPIKQVARALYAVDKTTPEGRILLQHVGDILRGVYGPDVARQHVVQYKQAATGEAEAAFWARTLEDVAGRPDALARCAWWWYQANVKPFPKPRVVFAAIGARTPEEVLVLVRQGWVWLHVERPEEERLAFLSQLYDGSLQRIMSHATEQDLPLEELARHARHFIRVWSSERGVKAPAGYCSIDQLPAKLIQCAINSRS